MFRNLDITAIRSFVAVADTGGVTKAAGLLNLTQSAVSMQLKRLEVGLGLDLLDRSGRGVALTATGEQLLGYARQMLSLNDEVYTRMTDQAFEGQIVLGVPHDIVYPAIPTVLQKFNRAYPRMKIQLVSSYTLKLKQMYHRGECDLILTTEDACGPEGATLLEVPLVWIGAPSGKAWTRRPLRLAFEYGCFFRRPVQQALDSASIPWEMGVEADSSRAIEASVSADLAVCTMLEGTEPAHLEVISHNGELPVFPTTKINLYANRLATDPVSQDLVGTVREVYRAL